MAVAASIQLLQLLKFQGDDDDDDDKEKINVGPFCYMGDNCFYF